MKDILIAIQSKLAAIPDLKYIDENWGQLTDYSTHPPTKFPLALIDVEAFDFSEIGIDKKATPQHRQLANGSITITVATIKLTNTSLHSAATSKQQAWQCYDLLDSVHACLHGFNATATASKLIRSGLRKVKREDGIQQFELTYTLALTNV